MISFYEFFNLFKKPQNMDFEKASSVHSKARGIPIVVQENCSECKLCENSCPTKAIQVKSREKIQFDYGACLQCGLCVEICEDKTLQNSGLNYVFSFHREELIIEYEKGDFTPKEYNIPENVKIFQDLTKKKGFNYREVAASGNNAVEYELGASFNNVFDSEGQMVRSVASPKHADAILYSGPVGKNMESPLNTAWECTTEPKVLIACGTEAISGGVYKLGKLPKTPDLFIAGDPPRPDVVLQAFRYLRGLFSFAFQKEVKNLLKK